MKKTVIIIFSVVACTVTACNKQQKADGYGNFEATEITVSSEASGRIVFLKINEGDSLEANALVGMIDTTTLDLNRQQLVAAKKTIQSRSASVLSQVAVLREDLKNAQTEKERLQHMFAENAATRQQVDQAIGKFNVINKQIKSIKTQDAPIAAEARSINVQIEKVNYQIQKSNIINPVKGIVLSKYAEPGEITSFGKPIYKVADLSVLSLRVYVGGPQLPALSLGQKVKVRIDVAEGMKEYEGSISWISSTAEFTPKVVQTKEERVNLVYPVKITIKNDGMLKIGMPAEMWLK